MSTLFLSHRSEEHTSELQSPCNLVCRLLLEKKKKKHYSDPVIGVRAALRSPPAVALRASAVDRLLVVSAATSVSAFVCFSFVFFFFNDTATTEIYTLSLHDALPIFHNPCVGNSAVPQISTGPVSSV